MTDLSAPDPDDDLAAELDDDDPDPGKLIVSRYPSGVLLADKAAGRAWVLDFDAAGGIYRCRDDAGAPLDPDGRWRAAEADTYEVRAYDPDFDGDEPPAAADPPAGPGGADYREEAA